MTTNPTLRTRRARLLVGSMIVVGAFSAVVMFLRTNIFSFLGIGALAVLAVVAALIAVARIEQRPEYGHRPLFSGHNGALLIALLAAPSLVIVGALLCAAVGWAVSFLSEDAASGVFFVAVLAGFSPIFGAPSHFLVGGPLAWWALKRWPAAPPNSWLFGAVLGVAANVIAGGLAIPVLMLTGESLSGAVDFALTIHAWGLALAPFYAIATVIVYRRVRRRA